MNLFFNIIKNFQSSIRDLVEAYVDTEASWDKQEKRIILKLIEKVESILFNIQSQMLILNK